MSIVKGVVTIAQESRFQLIDDDGVGHMLILDAFAMSEPDQLQVLAQRQARVLVHTKAGKGVIAARVATSIATL